MFTEMDKVLLQLDNDYAADPKWRGYAKSNNYSTFLMLLKRNFLDKASERYEQNDEFFVRLFKEPVFMEEVIDMFAPVLFERLKKESS